MKEAEYYETDSLAAMQISPSEEQVTTPIEEDAIMPFVSHTGRYYAPQAHEFQDFHYYNAQLYQNPGPEVYEGLMYADSVANPPQLGFFDNGSIPSPSSTLSSNSIQNMGFSGNFCLSKDFNPFYISQEQKITPDVKDCAREKEKHVVTTAKKNKEIKHYTKRQGQPKCKKRCSNCYSNNSPSWRRSISPRSKGALLCNACGLYEKTAKKNRMLVINDDGSTKVVRKRDARDYTCDTCGVQNVALWRKDRDIIRCEKCVRRSQRA